jgi:hypothetical protein
VRDAHFLPAVQVFKGGDLVVKFDLHLLSLASVGSFFADQFGHLLFGA